jgi:hypothetical protein
MRLKGKAKITLLDRATGKIVHSEEHTNTITPSLAKIFGSDIAGTLNYAKLTPVISKLLGGVCLFNGTLDNTKVFLPKASDATLTAHAGRNAYASAEADPKRGLPGGNSGPVNNGYRWVWEWTTTGNGTITDVVLTHADTGDYWNESSPNSMSSFSPIENVCNKVISPSEFGWIEQGVLFPHVQGSENIPIAFITDTNKVVTIEGNENNITVHIGKFTGAGAWIWNELGEIEDEQTFTFEPTPWQPGTFENFGIGCFYVAVANGKLYAIYCGQVTGTIYRPYAQNMTVNVLDLETGTASTSTIGCSTTLASYSNYERIDGEAMPEGVTFSLHAVNEFRDFNQLQIIDGSVFIPVFWGSYQYGGMTDCSIRVNLSDPTDQEIVKGFYNNKSGNYSDNIGQIDLGNGRIMNRCSMAWSDNGYKGQLITPNTDVFPIYFRYSRGYTAKQPSDSPVQFFTLASNSDGVRGCILNKLYQATVFHLETPVIKTANLNMTVEYTVIQEVQE